MIELRIIKALWGHTEKYQRSRKRAMRASLGLKMRKFHGAKGLPGPSDRDDAKESDTLEGWG